MKECYSENKKERMPGESLFAESTNVRYGIEPGIQKDFEIICNTKNLEERNALIDALISKMEQNFENNGFFTKEDVIYLGSGARAKSVGQPAFRIDDKTIYYDFFDSYQSLKEQFPDKKASRIHKGAIEATLEKYFGSFNGDTKKREDLTTGYADPSEYCENPDYKFEFPSVSVFKSQCCAMCVERASVSHNLWLIGGYESYFVDSGSIKLKNSNEKGHAYCLVNYDDKFKLFDPARGNFAAFAEKENVADEILSGNPFIVNGEVYANAFNLPKDINSV